MDAGYGWPIDAASSKSCCYPEMGARCEKSFRLPRLMSALDSSGGTATASCKGDYRSTAAITSMTMNRVTWRPASIVLLASIACGVAGCGIGHMFHRREAAAAPNTDVTNPGRPLPPPTPTPRMGSRKPASTVEKSKPSKSQTPVKSSASQCPVAKPVPGRPGLVLNPFKSNGGYIDVSGYAPGSKVKDPDTQKILGEVRKWVEEH